MGFFCFAISQSVSRSIDRSVRKTDRKEEEEKKNLVKEGGSLFKDPLEFDELVEVAIEDGLVVREDNEFVFEVTKVIEEVLDGRKIVELLKRDGSWKEVCFNAIEFVQLEALCLQTMRCGVSK